MAILCRGSDRLIDARLVMPAAICDGDALPFADDTFDAVKVAFSLHHLTHKDRVLAEMQSVPRPGGRLLLLGFTTVTSPASSAPTSGIALENGINANLCCSIGAASHLYAPTHARQLFRHPYPGGAADVLLVKHPG